ncbi:Pentatricopeptide repeat-containing protein, chloroplastic [Symbiodinium microadriaticum]|uniref:Pentatricopeptide repeat-containing protein, chloroplastic n=1 Tax=Symbiodinium microadriaticum TaxID=2951 RepID=A0A1Q9EQY1_SYMMI|nr:Pentatricopeptide repeat-containing protein, chloroplastic [Symbiodinium microadriaticum]
MAIKPEFEYEDMASDFVRKSIPKLQKRLEKRFQNYTWSFGVDEDDDGFTRDCVQLEVPTVRETEPRHVQAKLTKHYGTDHPILQSRLTPTQHAESVGPQAAGNTHTHTDFRLRPMTAMAESIHEACCSDQWATAVLLLQSLPHVGDQRACREVISCCALARQWQAAIEVLAGICFLSIVPTVYSFSAAITACEKGFQWELSILLLSKMVAARVIPNLISFSAAISACEKCGEWEAACHLLSQMLEQQVVPNRISYSAGMSACEKGNAWQMALYLLSDMPAGLVPDLICFDAGISACEKVGEWETAVVLLSQMFARGLSPNEISFSASISACEKSSEWQLALHFLSQMPSATARPNQTSFNAGISACEKGGGWQVAFLLLSQMLSANVVPDNISFNGSISASEKGSVWRMGLYIFSKMPIATLVPDEISFNAGISAGEKAREWRLAPFLLSQMPKARLGPNEVTFNASISAFEAGNAWQSALGCLSAMPAAEIMPSEINYNSSISMAATSGVKLGIRRKRCDKFRSRHLKLTVHGEDVINDDFSDERWLSVEDSYWELETKTNKAGERMKNIRYLLYLRNDCTKYITKTLFEKEKQELGPAAGDDSDDDTADTRIKMIANLKEPEPRREADVYFSEEEEFSEYECEGCGSKSVNVMKKAEDRCFKVYCNDCPYVSIADMHKEAPSIRRQREIDEARARKKKEKEKKKEAEKLAIEDKVPVDLAELEEVVAGICADLLTLSLSLGLPPLQSCCGSAVMSRALVLVFAAAGIVWLAHPTGAFVPGTLRPPRTNRLPRHAEAEAAQEAPAEGLTDKSMAKETL